MSQPVNAAVVWFLLHTGLITRSASVFLMDINPPTPLLVQCDGAVTTGGVRTSVSCLLAGLLSASSTGEPTKCCSCQKSSWLRGAFWETALRFAALHPGEHPIPRQQLGRPPPPPRRQLSDRRSETQRRLEMFVLLLLHTQKQWIDVVKTRFMIGKRTFSLRNGTFSKKGSCSLQRKGALSFTECHYYTCVTSTLWCLLLNQLKNR